MATTLLYHQDDYLTNFEAKVLSVDKETQSIILDATAFYPTGGHQRCDQGQIKKGRRNYLVITDVKKDDSGVVYHRYLATKGAIDAGDTIAGTIHWERRLRHMQLHTSQHIFTRFAQDRFGICTGRADFGPDGGLAVMEKPLTWEEILLLEDDVNRVIAAGRRISRSIDSEGVITITVDQVDDSFCGGTHVRSTSEIGLFKVTSVQSKNIYYEVGDRARQVAIRMANDAMEAAAVLNVSDTRGLSGQTSMLLAEKEAADSRLHEWKENTTREQITKANQTAISLNDKTTAFTLDLSHMNTKAVKNLVKADLLNEQQVWVCLAERRNLIISSASADVNARNVLQKLIDEWGMSGGGNPGLAQGGPVPDQIRDPLGSVTSLLLNGNGRQQEPVAQLLVDIEEGGGVV